MTEKKQMPSQKDQSGFPMILVVTQDLKLLKLLDMALKLEIACAVLGFVSARSAEETAKSVKPALVILDEQFLDGNIRDLSDHLHHIEGLSQVPTLFLNAMDLSRSQSDHTLFLRYPWKVEE